MHWRSASSMDRIDKDSWVEENDANYTYTCDGGMNRYSFGVCRIDDDINKSKRYSLAALCTQEYLNAVLILKLTLDENSVYWGCIIQNGVPELDVIHENINDTANSIYNLLEDDVSKVLNVSNPIFATNISDENLNDYDAVVSLLDIKNFNKNIFEIDDLILLMSASSRYGVLKSANPNILASISQLPLRDVLAVIICLIVIFSVIWFIFFNKEESIVTNNIVNPIANLANQNNQQHQMKIIEERNEAERKVSKAILDQRIGITGKWVFFILDKVRNWPDYIGGYKKRKLVCSLAAGKCSVEYINLGDYKNFALAYESLNKLGDVFFDQKGNKLTVDHAIERSLLSFVEYDINQLPIFDAGKSIIPIMNDIELSSLDLSMQINAGEIIVVDLGKSYSGDVYNKFSSIGWSSIGRNSYQITTVINKLNAIMVSYNHLEVAWSDSGESPFTLTGSYLMQADEEIKDAK